jgi:hypothetical protein
MARGFQPGNKLSTGRPAGARNRLSTRFLQALLEDFEQHGPKVIELARRESPIQYLRIIGACLPKEFLVETSTAVGELSDEDLDQLIEQFQRALLENREPMLLIEQTGMVNGKRE